MKLFGCMLFTVFLQISTGQVLQYGQRNAAPGQGIPNQPTPTQHIANGNANTIHAIQNTGIPRTGNNGIPYIPNVANAHMPNVIHDQALIANGGVISHADANNIAINPNMGALANLANINGNMATFNLGNGGFTVTSGSPGSPGFGIQVLADALEVGGTVAVNGQIPIYGSVTLNGHLPTDGAASVRYTCGGPTPTDGVLN